MVRRLSHTFSFACDRLRVLASRGMAGRRTVRYSARARRGQLHDNHRYRLGVGANSAPTTLTLSVSPTGQIDFGQVVTVTALVAPQMSSTATPTGIVQFSVDGTNYGSPMSLGTDGSAVEAITELSGGAHVIDATYGGDSSFASSASTAPLSLTIASAPTVTTLTAAINGSTAAQHRWELRR